jgi:hypothetical protein
MNTLLSKPMFAPLREKIEKGLISRFKASYGVYDKRLNKPNVRAIKVSYVGNYRIYIETTYKRGMHCSHSYLVENEILNLLAKKCSNAILFNAITCLSKENILKNAKRYEEKPFGYVIGYLKDVYKLPKMIGGDVAEKILKYFEIENECVTENF